MMWVSSVISAIADSAMLCLEFISQTGRCKPPIEHERVLVFLRSLDWSELISLNDDVGDEIKRRKDRDLEAGQ